MKVKWRWNARGGGCTWGARSVELVAGQSRLSAGREGRRRGAGTWDQEETLLCGRRLLFVAVCLSWAGHTGRVRTFSYIFCFFFHKRARKIFTFRTRRRRRRGGTEYLPATGEDEGNLGSDPEGRVWWGAKPDGDVNTDHQPLTRR